MICELILATALMGVAPDSPKTLFKPDLFQTLVDPDCSYCHVEEKRAGDVLKSDDRVLAWIRGDHEGGAVPYRWFLAPYRVISDTYGVFVYDPDAGFVRGWPASVDFRFHGWRNGIMTMRHKDGTLFDCLTGEAFDGPRKGERLKPIPTIETTWGSWSKLMPKSVAYEMKPQFRPMPLPSAVDLKSKSTRPAPDPRLDPEARVFGLVNDGKAAAWPSASFGSGVEIHRLAIGRDAATILHDGRTGTTAAYSSFTEGKTPRRVDLELDAGDETAPFVDRTTGSRWSIAGRCVSGKSKGESLKWLPGVAVKWSAWAAAYPDTTLDPIPLSSPK